MGYELVRIRDGSWCGSKLLSLTWWDRIDLEQPLQDEVYNSQVKF